jgi:hypothetical protein
VNIAECIVASGQEPKTQLGIFAEIIELILGHVLLHRLIILLLMFSSHVFATIDQPKSILYIQGVKEVLENWLQVNRKTKKALSYAMIRLVQVVITVWRTKRTSSDVFSTTLKATTEELSATFKALLLSNLQRCLQNPETLTKDDGERCMSLYSTMDALGAIDVAGNDLANLQIDTMSTLDCLKELNLELYKRFELFMTEHYPQVFSEPLKQLLRGDVAAFNGREAIRRKALAMTKQMAELEKAQLVDDLLEEVKDEQALDKLLALKHVISSCKGKFPRIICLAPTSN